MKNIKTYIVGYLIIAGSILYAQKLKIYEGDKTLAFLKGETTLNVEFSYDNMLVGSKPEADYMLDKKTDFNKKTPGKGDRWAERWVKNKEIVYEPMFEELLGTILFKSKTNVTAARKQNQAKYTILVKTTKLEPGFNIVVSKQDPYCNYEIWFIESSSKNVLAKGTMKNVFGIVMFDNDWEFDPSGRIKECYAKAGKVCGKAISKAVAVKK